VRSLRCVSGVPLIMFATVLRKRLYFVFFWVVLGFVFLFSARHALDGACGRKWLRRADETFVMAGGGFSCGAGS